MCCERESSGIIQLARDFPPSGVALGRCHTCVPCLSCGREEERSGVTAQRHMPRFPFSWSSAMTLNTEGCAPIVSGPHSVLRGLQMLLHLIPTTLCGGCYCFLFSTIVKTENQRDEAVWSWLPCYSVLESGVESMPI